MKTLHLPLKAKWYKMIESGEKTEEYREIKPYWKKRLFDGMGPGCEKCRSDSNHCSEGCILISYDFKAVRFSYGYTKRTMTFEIESISIGKGKSEWGAPEQNVFIIKLGKRCD